MHTGADTQSIKKSIEHRTAHMYQSGSTTTSNPHSTTVLGCSHGLLNSLLLIVQFLVVFNPWHLWESPVGKSSHVRQGPGIIAGPHQTEMHHKVL